MADNADDFHFAEDFSLRQLEDDCSLLGNLLDDCLRIELGDAQFSKIEKIRTLAFCASQLSQKNDEEASKILEQKLVDDLMSMQLEEAISLARACGHYLNLTSIAETHHSVRTSRGEGVTKTCDEVFGALIAQGLSKDELYNAVCNQQVDIVLTAHPTQVNRRTLQYKHTRIAALLAQNDRKDLTQEERENNVADLVREITSLWQTDELRRRKPTPLDEARGGLHIVEQSLWAAVPAYLRRVNNALKKHTDRELPLTACPLVFGTWMGGDRDGNDNVTAKVTHNVACLARWMAADLYLREVDVLRFELSMSHANEEVWQMAKEVTLKSHTGESHAGEDSSASKGLGHGHMATTPAIHLRHVMRSSSSSLAYSSAGNSASNVPALAGQPEPVDLPSVPAIGPFVNVDGSQLEVGSPPSDVLWSPDKSPTDHQGSEYAAFRPTPSPPVTPPNERALPTFDNGVSATFSGTAGNHTRRKSSSASNLDGVPEAKQVTFDGAIPELTQLPVNDSDEVAFSRQPSWALPRYDKQGNVLTPADIKKRGKQAAAYHKTGIDAMLHPRHAGATPYRIILGDVRQKLVNTRRRMEEILAGQAPEEDQEWYETVEELAEPLLAIFWSLWECGGGSIAEGRLLDLIRRVSCFGLSLMKMDLRQESSRHSEALDAVTKFLDMGSYNEWDEDTKLAFLAKELRGKRPLIPPSMPMTPRVKEVVDTFRAAAVVSQQSLGAYVISMATYASDVLAVELLKREACLAAVDAGQKITPSALQTMRVVPLFETLSDLEGAGRTMRQLFSIEWYRDLLRDVHNNHQEVMLGYSDSGKDAGRLSAAWALYKCQEELVDVCRDLGISLTLFHGRGGSVGRGGGPMYLAIQSQPPGSVQGSLRITEQGEMVQNKFGIPAVAQRQLEIFTTAVLLATKKPPMAARDETWRGLMDELSRLSCEDYRAIVFKHEDFIPYFRQATPEAELGHLNIGSRPARRKANGGVSQLRAIPWIFAWTQTRMVLPAWLGVGSALTELFAKGHKAELQAMYAEWPFFQSTLDLIEMVLAKADMRIASLYDETLVTDPKHKALGQMLRNKFMETVQGVLEVTGHTKLCQNNASLRRLIETRNPHIDPINILQVEVLRRLRQEPDNRVLRDTLLITINGIASGMRNTG